MKSLIRTYAVALIILIIASLPWPSPVAADGGARNDGDTCPPNRLLGTWSSETDGAWWVRLTGDELTLAEEDELLAVLPVVSCDGDTVVVCDSGLPKTVLFRAREAEDGVELELPRTRMRDEERFRLFVRQDTAPGVLDPQPLTIPAPRDLSPERVDRIRAELARRREIDQAARQGPLEGMDFEKMAEIDRDNTAWLQELVTEVGWIDAKRYGDEAANAAWLIVQHSGDVPLMMGALPHIQEHGDPVEHAYLFDRLALRLGDEQRYGSQFRHLDDGKTALSPLKNPDGVDARRAEIGLPPLGAFMARVTGDESFLDDLRVSRCP